MSKIFDGLNTKRKNFHFLNRKDLIKYFIWNHYPDEYVLVIYDCIKAFTEIPRLNITKRDDYTVYLFGLMHDYVILIYNNLSSAKDFAYSLPANADFQFTIYDKGVPVYNEKGIIKKNGKGKEL